ncbi:MAG: phytanoyl-CoA dioxygenase family protein [Bacteroidota bacterium]
MTNPDLSSEYHLTQEQCASYQRDGHIVLRGVATRDAVELVRPAIVGVVDEVARSRDTQGRKDDYGKMFTQVSNVWGKNDGAREFILAKRFAKIAADLMDVDGVRLYHDQALIKEPGGKPTPWHQDHYYWPLETENTITMWMPLIDVTPQMGTMSFATGSHKNKSFKQLPISETSQEYFERIIRDEKCPTPSYSLNAGDATFHSGWTLHSAHGNGSTQRREVITIIYYADGTRIMEPDNDHRKVDLEVFHPGQKPGEVAACELNPLLFSRTKGARG